MCQPVHFQQTPGCDMYNACYLVSVLLLRSLLRYDLVLNKRMQSVSRCNTQEHCEEISYRLFLLLDNIAQHSVMPPFLILSV